MGLRRGSTFHPLFEFLDVHGHNAFEKVEHACEGNPRLQLAITNVVISPSHELHSRWNDLRRKYGTESKH
jgi:hypothetical protein